MARMIDADVAIKRFRGWLESPHGENVYHSGYDDAIWHVLDVIEHMPTLTPPNEWVSVEERLPGVSGNYICTVKDKNGGKWTIPSEWNLEMKTWFGAFGEIKNKVTHWMPLPAPPAKEGDR